MNRRIAALLLIITLGAVSAPSMTQADSKPIGSGTTVAQGDASSFAGGRSINSADAEPLDSARAAKIKADLKNILSGRDYEVDQPGEGPLSQVGKWISDRWNQFTSWLRRIFSFGGRVGSGGSALLPYVLFGLLICLIAYGIAYAAKNYQRKPSVAKTKPAVGIVLEPEESAETEPDAWIAAARQHASIGDFRKAYRAVFIAILIRLDRVGAIRFERSKTNGDYIRSLRSAPKLLAFLRPLVGDFDARWYGRADATESDYRGLLSSYASIPVRPA